MTERKARRTADPRRAARPARPAAARQPPRHRLRRPPRRLGPDGRGVRADLQARHPRRDPAADLRPRSGRRGVRRRRFDKKVSGGLANLRKGPVDTGLFTSDTDDPLWHRAHNILMAPFSLQSMRDYMPKMLDIADQLMDKWSRLNPGEEVDVPADMTRLTLDTIALCGFGYRFNSFYRDTPHPFVEAMMGVLAESQARARQLPVQTRLRIRAQRQLEEDQAFMNDLVDRIIAERRAARGGGDAADTTDLLGRMLTGVDKQTGEKLPGRQHPRAVHHLPHRRPRDDVGPAVVRDLLPAQEPGRARRARDEVDEVLGTTAGADVRAGPPPALRPADPRRDPAPVADRARLHPPALRGHRDRRPVRDPGGHPDHRAQPGAAPAHRGLGPDAAEFNPDHTAAERMAAIPPNAYKPFGTGAAGLHRPAVRPPGGDAGARHAGAALRVRRPPATTSSRRRRPSPSSPTTSTSRSDPGRACASSARRPAAAAAGRRPADAAGGRRRAARRPARHPAVGALRLEPRHRRGDRDPAGAGGHRARAST